MLDGVAIAAWRRLTMGAAALLLTAGAAGADEIGSAFRLFDTVRIGAFAHNPGMRESGEVAVSAHVLTSRLGAGGGEPTGLVEFLLTPRLHAGAMINTEGHTSYGYAGLTWRTGLIGNFFAEFEFGGAVNNYVERPDRIDMGCHVTFRESAGLGYRFSDHVDVLASIEHASHAQLCSDQNSGITQIGARLGYRF